MWGAAQQKAFEDTLNLISNIKKMYHYDKKRNFNVKCDASHSGRGAAFEQELPDGSWVPISFSSRFLNVQEKKYSTNELKLLGVVWSCERFRNYLLGNRLKVLTDHKAIISAFQSNGSRKYYQSPLTRWADRLFYFDFKVTHNTRTKLAMFDYLSRRPTFEAPQPSNFDERFFVKSIQIFFRLLNNQTFLQKRV